ncbi:MAG: hypothetical protein R6X35_15680 [Candidatus Krumholzibacteriia bacterium]
MHRTPRRRSLSPLFLTVLASALVLAAAATAQPELSYEQYRGLAWAADRLDHVTMFEPLDGEAGMHVAVAERFGTVQVFKADGRGVSRAWKSIRLGGVPEEILTGDLDGDGFDDSLVCRTSSGQVYVWRLSDYALVWQSLPSEYQSISCFTIANVDDDAAHEIVLLADRRLNYVDGVNFTREFTSIREYEATMVRCGDVDGDGRVEIVLNSGQVLDSVSGDVEWEDEAFYSRIELLDIDGDGMPEILTENDFSGPLKVFDVDYRSEVRFQ